ncbi:MAG: hypothetical protein ACE5NN_02560 [Candidatus Bathyarchaeia archaeon]
MESRISTRVKILSDLLDLKMLKGKSPILLPKMKYGSDILTELFMKRTKNDGMMLEREKWKEPTVTPSLQELGPSKA